MSKLQVPAVFEPLVSPARYKGAHGGRGSGKSHFFGGFAIAKAATQPFRLVCVREVQRSIADSVKQLLEDKIEELGLSSFFTITDQEIRGKNGSLIIFRGLQNHTAASIKSLEGFDAAWVEEAQTISQRSLDLLIPTIRNAGSELWFSWNPGADTDPVDRLLRESPPDTAVVVQANWSDNPWFPDELRGDMERDRERDPDKYAHVWAGEYQTRSEARVFRNWRIGTEEPQEGIVWNYGVDWGFSTDPTAAVRFCIPKPLTLYIDYEAFEVGCPVERTPMLVGQIPDATKWPLSADSARPETIDYMRRNGFPLIRGAKKGKGSVEHGITFLQSFDIVVHPRCVNLIKEFENYSYKTDRITGDIVPIIEDNNNHGIDALRYAAEKLHVRGSYIVKDDDVTRRPNYDYGIEDDEEESISWKTA